MNEETDPAGSTTTRASGQLGRMKDARRQAMHIFALSSFAFAQPVFDILGRNATFFVAQRAGPVDVIAVTAFLILVPPFVIVALAAAIGVAWPRGGRWIREAAVGGLLAVFVMPVVTRGMGIGMVLALPMAVGIMIGGMLTYRRSATARRLLTWLAPAPLVFAALFLFGGSVREIVLPRTPVIQGALAGSGAPVVVITFDEFSLVPLMKPDGSLDRRSFPNFARLADRGTWYPGATTVHYATDHAVPASLSGKMPTGEKVLPLAADHPETLFTLLGSQYEMRTFETITHLCPRGLCREPGRRPPDRARMAKDIAVVLLHLLLPEDAAKRLLPALGDRWVGFGAAASDVDRADALGAAGARPTADDLRQGPGYEDPPSYFQRFVDSIERPSRPTLWYIHSLLPHKPWRYLPSGKMYEGPGHHQPGWTTFLWTSNRYLTEQAQQRYVLQVQYADSLLGSVLDRLENEGILNETLLVAYADHGVSFTPEAPPRRIVRSNVAEILPVPLFVKLPRQKEGVIDRRNAQIIDVLPTIADGLGVDVPWKTDGFSLVGPDPKVPGKYCFNFDGGRSYPAKIGGIRKLSRQMRSLFGGSFDDLYGFGPNADFVGRRLASLPVDDPIDALTFELDRPGSYDDVDPASSFVPARVTGVVQGANARPGVPVAVTIDGAISGVGQTFSLGGRVQVSVMVDPGRFSEGRADLRLYVVSEDRHLAPVVTPRRTS